MEEYAAECHVGCASRKDMIQVLDEIKTAKALGCSDRSSVDIGKSQNDSMLRHYRGWLV